MNFVLDLDAGITLLLCLRESAGSDEEIEIRRVVEVQVKEGVSK